MPLKRLTQLGVPIGIVAIVVMLVVPLPAMVLDVLIALNITGALLVLMVAMFVKRPLDFAAFPAVVLVMTLFRLALNVSATRLVLLDGYAGKVIDTFGHFVVGGSLVVGMIVFVILLVIQFVVITNGAGRVAEVGARFTLDAMPGKQMAIDADLNSGLITEDQARQRRADVHAEADFYGAMDGASKFVKGDAIAAIIITLVNLIGGFAIGVAQLGMPMGEAIQTYSLLSIGDGLVSQIPALLLSVATGLIVTRNTGDDDMGSDILRQIGGNRMPLRIAGFAAFSLCLIPGLPKIPFLLAGGLMLLASTRVPVEEEPQTPEQREAEALPSPDSPERLAAEIQVDALGLELSPDIIDLVDPSVGGDLLDRVKALRRKVASDIGIVVPPVRTRDNIELPARTYAITLFGIEVARGEAPPGSVMAIGDLLGNLPGHPTVEPVFGLEAKWIPSELRAQAELSGATVVDRASVITTHLSEVVTQHAARLLGREDVRLLTDVVKRTHPVVIEELTPAQLSLGEVQRCSSRCSTSRSACATWSASSRRSHCAPPSPRTSTDWWRPPARPWARPSWPPTCSPATCTSSASTPSSSTACSSRCAPPSRGPSWRWTLSSASGCSCSSPRSAARPRRPTSARCWSAPRRSVPRCAAWCVRRSTACRCSPTPS
nr:flagellar biosynthesis protein FlhA [Nocardioides daphniae]